MLILTRKVGESIMIGADVSVKVLGVRSGQVKLGVAAPRELPVHREEIYERIKAETAERGGDAAAANNGFPVLGDR